MNGEALIDRLRRELGARTDGVLAHSLGVTQGRISQLRSKKEVTAREVANMIARTRRSPMKGAGLVDRLRKELDARTDGILARTLSR
jgi:hypothetical protein